jgi:hypothetical protein
MPEPKKLRQREKELQALLASPEGRTELKNLADRYAAVGDRPRPPSSSLVTYVLVHERERGLILD